MVKINNNIWKKRIIRKLETEISKHEFDINMNSRRKNLKNMIEERLQENESNNNEIASESLFDF